MKGLDEQRKYGSVRGRGSSIRTRAWAVEIIEGSVRSTVRGRGQSRLSRDPYDSPYEGVGSRDYRGIRTTVRTRAWAVSRLSRVRTRAWKGVAAERGELPLLRPPAP